MTLYQEDSNTHSRHIEELMAHRWRVHLWISHSRIHEYYLQKGEIKGPFFIVWYKWLLPPLCISRLCMKDDQSKIMSNLSKPCVLLWSLKLKYYLCTLGFKHTNSFQVKVYTGVTRQILSHIREWLIWTSFFTVQLEMKTQCSQKSILHKRASYKGVGYT